MRDKALREGENQIVLNHLDLLTLIKGRDMVQHIFKRSNSGVWITEELVCRQEYVLKMLAVKIWIIPW